jgi:hypothetical protein
MSSVPGRSRSTDTVLVRYAQRVSNGIVLDIGAEGGGKKVTHFADKAGERLLQIDWLVAAMLVELGTPYLVRALVVAWTEAN